MKSRPRKVLGSSGQLATVSHYWELGQSFVSHPFRWFTFSGALNFAGVPQVGCHPSPGHGALLNSKRTACKKSGTHLEIRATQIIRISLKDRKRAENQRTDDPASSVVDNLITAENGTQALLQRPCWANPKEARH